MLRWSVRSAARASTTAVAAAVLLAAGCVADSGGTDGSSAPPTVSPTACPIEMVNACPELVALVEWGLARFDAAGLALPDIAVIHFDDDGERCDTADGWAVLSSQGYELLFCFDDPPTSAEDAVVRHAIVHELAHTWLHANLDDVDRQHFLDHAGLDTWNDLEVPWGRRGVERAAEAISWLVLDDPDAVLTLGGERELLESDAELIVAMATQRPRHP